MDRIIAASLNNEALKLESVGDYTGAEKKHIEALTLKTKSRHDSNGIGKALTQNGLGELYLKMGKIDQAQEMLEAAYKIRKHHDNFDRSCTADNLGRLFEMKGNNLKAVEWRTVNGPNRMICSNFNCPISQLWAFSKLDELKKCAKCKCVYYCGKKCQKQDWDRHNLFCKVPDTENKKK